MSTSAPEEPPVVIKIGGALLQGDKHMETLWHGVRTIQEETPVIFVHGGGSQATAMAERLGHDPKIVEGRRVTSDLDLQIAQWTMRGTLNTKLVSQALRADLRPVGLSGADGQIVSVSKRPPWEIDGETVDFGWVGNIETVYPDLLFTLLNDGFLPIIAPLGIDEDGQIYNVNADTVARAIAQRLDASRLLLLTETGGVQKEVDGERVNLSECDREMFAAGTREGWIHGGMQVKLEVAFEALRGGVDAVHILSPDDILSHENGTTVVL